VLEGLDEVVFRRGEAPPKRDPSSTVGDFDVGPATP
jgi:hypothetical protein